MNHWEYNEIRNCNQEVGAEAFTRDILGETKRSEIVDQLFLLTFYYFLYNYR